MFGVFDLQMFKMSYFLFEPLCLLRFLNRPLGPASQIVIFFLPEGSGLVSDNFEDFLKEASHRAPRRQFGLVLEVEAVEFSGVISIRRYVSGCLVPSGIVRELERVDLLISTAIVPFDVLGDNRFDCLICAFHRVAMRDVLARLLHSERL